jgi:toxin YoeB
MNKKTIVWTELAEEELKNIIDYWNVRNQTDTYTIKLLKKLKTFLELLALHPKIGRKSSQRENVRIKVFMQNFLIIYRTEGNILFVLDFWDTRKNPDNNEYIG